ncbi:imidazolonepropionase [Asaia siamensis]
MWDRLWINANLAQLASHGNPHDGETGAGLLRDGAIAVEQGRIAWFGSRRDLPGAPEALATEVIDCRGAWITPGLIDPHTHLVYAGDRSGEFSERLNGLSYQEIARRGGGILSTVKATRAASEDELFALSEKRAKRLMANGVTTVEIKSGYGLTLEDELKQLRVARRLGSELRLRVHVTFLGAHALPPEFVGRREAYVEHLCCDLLPRVAAEKLADSVDGFCEGIAFQPHEIERLFAVAQDLGFALRLHADQLSDLGGASLAARMGALSADHVEYAHEDGIRAMAAQGTVAVLLPGAFYFVREEKMPPVKAFRTHGVRMALATDCNPGTSPLLSPTVVMNMACTLFRLTPREALYGHTCHAAAALGLSATCGVLAPGFAADMALWDITSPDELAYWIGGVMPIGRVFAGVPDEVH